MPPCLWGQYSLGGKGKGYGLAAGLLPEVSLRAKTITTSIPATSATRPQPDVLGAFDTLGVGVAVGAGVGVDLHPTPTDAKSCAVTPA